MIIVAGHGWFALCNFESCALSLFAFLIVLFPTASSAAQSRADFLSKMSIAYKEARETRYWVRLLHDTGYLDASEFEELYGAADELCRIIGSIIKATKENDGRRN